MKERIAWVDWAKGYGIFMIMLLHVSQYFSEMALINRYVTSFSVAFFFVLSGYVSSNTDKNRITKKAVKRLLVPYVIFSLFNSGLKVAVLLVTNNITMEGLKKEAIELFITGNGTVWFLMTLFLIEVVYSVINKLKIPYYARTIFVITFLLVPFIVKIEQNPIYIMLSRVILGLAFYLLGEVYKTVRSLYKCEKGFISVIYLILGAIIAIYGNGLISFFTGEYRGAIAAISSVLFTCLGYLELFQNLDKVNVCLVKRILAFFGRNSLIIMLIHPIILLFFTYPFGGFFNQLQGVYSFGCGICVYVVLVVMEVPFIYVINKYFKFLLGK